MNNKNYLTSLNWRCNFCLKTGNFNQISSHEKICSKRPRTLGGTSQKCRENKRNLMAAAAEKRSKLFKQGGRGKGKKKKN